jgi:hypothetical protein
VRGPCLCLEDTPQAISEGHTSSALLQKLPAAIQPSKPRTKARGGVCRKAAASNHAEGQLRRLPETARLLHRCNNAMRGAGRSVLQVAMQSYYVVSSSRLFLIRCSKQISKTTSTQQAEAKQPIRHHEKPHLPCFWAPATSPSTKSTPRPSLQSSRPLPNRSHHPRDEQQRHRRASSIPRHTLHSQQCLFLPPSILQSEQSPHHLEPRTQPRRQTAYSSPLATPKS